MRFLLRGLLVGLLLAGAAVALVYGWAVIRVGEPGPLAAERQVVVPRGAGTDTIARLLAEAGVVREPLLFAVWARWQGQAGRLRAGEYAFPPGVSITGAIELLASGKTVRRRLTLAEGLSARDIARLVEEAPGLDGPVEPPIGEGEVLPETYFYSWGDRRADVVARMRRAMAEAVEAAWAARSKDLPLGSPAELVTLASIVEKETGLPEERALVAGVFVNRLRRGMKLQADPTVVYAVAGGGPLDRPLTRRDLETASPYNTYVAAGLPPGPIATPGRAALIATAAPAETEHLYFVADGNGGHAFARTLAEHNRNVQRWRQRQREDRSD